MECSSPPPLSEDALSAALDGNASAAVQEHLTHCPYCEARLQSARRLEQRLKKTLYQFDCPPSQQLVDFDAGLLEPAEAVQLQQHVNICPRCTNELRVLSRFLDQDEEPVPALRIVHSNRERPQERIAQPRTDVGAWAARGLQDGDVQDWEAAGATIFLELNRHAEGLVLSGQVVDGSVENWVGALAELRQEGALQGVSVLDEMGEFRFNLDKQAPVDLNITAINGITLVLENVTLTE